MASLDNRSRGERTLLRAVAFCAAIAASGGHAQSLCDDYHVPAQHLGNVEGCVFTNANNTTTIHFNAPAILHWQNGFKVGATQHLRFNFNNLTRGAVLNRDLSGQNTILQGQISSNGRVMLLNPGNTISIQPGAVIAADGGFLASTLEVSDEEALLRGDPVEFVGNGDASSAIDNRGTISSANGDVVLISRSVNNIAVRDRPESGRLIARDGNVRIATGTHVRLFGNADSPIEVLEGSGLHTITNSGTIAARDTVQLNTFGIDAAEPGDSAIDNHGTIRTTNAGGRVFLRARSGRGDVLNSSTGLIDTEIVAVTDANLINMGRIIEPSDGGNPAPPSGARQFPRLSGGALTSTPTDDFRLSRLSFSHLNGLESKPNKPVVKTTSRPASKVTVRGGATSSQVARKKPAPQTKKVILRRGSFFGKKTS